MTAADTTTWTLFFVLPLVLASPWIVAVVWSWHRRPREDYVPPSLAEAARRRLWS